MRMSGIADGMEPSEVEDPNKTVPRTANGVRGRLRLDDKLVRSDVEADFEASISQFKTPTSKAVYKGNE